LLKFEATAYAEAERERAVQQDAEAEAMRGAVIRKDLPLPPDAKANGVRQKIADDGWK
jgi:hypothetical protein